MLPRLRLEAGEEIGASDAERVSRVLAEGGLVAYPTESFYGLGGDPWNRRAVRALIDRKGDRADRPIPLVVGSTAAVLRVACALPRHFRTLADRFWPGPLTLVLPAHPELPEELTAGTGTVGVRVSSHPVARALARLAGGAITSTSANPSGAPPPCEPDGVERYFGAGGVALLVDGGPTPGGQASTVLDLTRQPPRLVRAGPVSRATLVEALGEDLALPARPD